VGARRWRRAEERRRTGGGAVAQPRESEDRQRWWLPVRASLGVIRFRLDGLVGFLS
jgi:hypothetical protein